MEIINYLYLQISKCVKYLIRQIKGGEIVNLTITDKNIKMLNKLPLTLKYLDCSGLNLLNLPELPPTLEYLNCSDNRIIYFPELHITTNYYLKYLNYYL